MEARSVISYKNDDHSRFAALNRTRDGELYDKICEALLNNPYVDATNITIEIDKAIVTLSGKVEDRFMKKEVEICLEGLRGIRDVINKLELYSFNDSGSTGLIKN